MHFCLTNLGIFWGYFPMNSVQARKRGRGAHASPPTHKFLKKEKKRKERKKKKRGEKGRKREEKKECKEREKKREKKGRKGEKNLTTPPFVREGVKREAE